MKEGKIMPILYMLCGIPASGKSTYAKKFLKEHNNVKYVSRDEIRLSIIKDDEEYFSHEDEVFQNFTDIIACILIDGFDCIADATHLHMFSRKKLTMAIDQYIEDYKIVYVIFNTDIVTCLMRNRLRQGRARVTDKILCTMYNKWDAPNITEDSRAIKIILVVE